MIVCDRCKVTDTAFKINKHAISMSGQSAPKVNLLIDLCEHCAKLVSEQIQNIIYVKILPNSGSIRCPYSFCGARSYLINVIEVIESEGKLPSTQALTFRCNNECLWGMKFEWSEGGTIVKYVDGKGEEIK